MLEVKNMTVQYGGKVIVADLDFTVGEGQWVMLVGPNGAGKSTIVNAISQGVRYTGTVTYEGQNVAKMKPVQIAQNIGVLSQNHYVTYAFTVGEVVNIGRYSHSEGIFGSSKENEGEMVRKALEKTGMLPFENQSVLTLSGGELQRTFLAQIFAQNPKLLILDEPTNHLDLVYQKQVFELISEWLKEPGRAVVSVVHDLSLARAYGTDAILLDKGRAIASGKLEDVITRENLKSVYNMDVYGWMLEMLAQWEER